MRLRVCNELVGSVQSLDGVDTAYGILQLPTTVSNLPLHTCYALTWQTVPFSCSLNTVRGRQARYT